MTNALPLNGCRILALSQFGAGPFGTMVLADLGAEVIKIEDPVSGGDVSRYVPPYTGDRDSLYFQSLNRNKRSITLNLRHPAGRDVLHDLVRISDGFFSSLRGDQPERLGLTYEHLKHANPRIVCCSLTGFGMTGPRRAEPGYDYLMQAYAGFMSLTGEPESPPAKSGVSVVDFSAGLAAMLGMVSGILAAQRTGKGCDVDVSLLDTAVSMLSYLAIWMLNRDYHPRRLPNSSHPTVLPSQIFPTADGYIAIMCAKQKFWEALAVAMDAPEWANDPRFRTFADRLANRDALTALLEDRFKTQTTADWLSRLRGTVPCAPVNTVEEALQDEQVLAREMIVEVEHPVFGTLKQTATPVKVPGTSAPRRPAPALGADTEPVLREYLGYSVERIKELSRVGVITLPE